jgi:predicted component of type VI protein secretion system
MTSRNRETGWTGPRLDEDGSMASMPEPVRGGSPQYAPGIRLTLSLKGQHVQSYTFDKTEVAIGRDPYCDVYVDNPGVSRQHFKLDHGETGEWRVTDLGSANGTYLNDRPVKVGTLRDGDVVQFGKYSLLVNVDELVGGDESGVRRHSAAEGATMMLSPSEVRQMVAEARSGATAGPKLAVVPRDTRMAAPAPAPEVTNQNAWMIWAGLAVLAAVAVAVYALVSR